MPKRILQGVVVSHPAIVSPFMRCGVDTGGTFTDCVALAPSGETHRTKVLSTSALRGVVERQRAAERGHHVHQQLHAVHVHAEAAGAGLGVPVGRQGEAQPAA